MGWKILQNIQLIVVKQWLKFIKSYLKSEEFNFAFFSSSMYTMFLCIKCGKILRHPCCSQGGWDMNMADVTLVFQIH